MRWVRNDYPNTINKLIIRDDGVIAVAAALEPIVPPTGHKNISGIRYIGPKHVPKNLHSFF